MNKENAPPPAIAGVDLQSPPLTAEQRSRITRNFRAAKALLARKRPLASPIPPFKSVSISPSLHSIHPPLVRCNNVNQPPRRVPLAEIQPNRFSTPAAKPPIVYSATASTSSSAASATPQSILDEDLDDDFLRQIDAICEMSTAKKARPTPESAPATLARDSNLPQKLMAEVLDGNSSPMGVDGGRGLFDDANIVLPLVTAASPVKAELPAADSRPVDGDNSSMVDGGRSLFQDGDADLTPPKYREYFRKLNDAQREAACCDIGQPLMIVAGPGSGKTSTMVGRVLTLLKEGNGPANILAMTFTTAAASEMRDRIKAVVGKEIAKEVAISTFHSFCLKLCRAHAEKLGRTSEFLIYGHGQQRRAVIEALRLLENGRKSEVIGGHKLDEIANGAENFKEKSKKWQKFVTQAKASGKTPEEFTTMGDEIGAGVLGHYNDILKSCNALDYHDFISCSVKLLEDFPEVHKESLEMWKAIVVDEFQDTSSMQYHLLKILASHNRVTIVGDDDQSIFSFNGANVCGFDSFRRDFPTHKEIRLNKNYRSTRCIVEAATSLICNNRKRYQSKKAETDNSIGCKITVKECHNEDAQCAFVVDKILEITSDDPSSSCSFGNVAILYRRQISGKSFQSSFRDRKIPFNIHGVAFYRKKVIKAILAILRTTLPGCDDNPSRQAFKALYNGDKEEKKMVIDYIEKVSSARKCGFLSAATDIFASKISGTLRRTQLTQGRKVLSTLDMLSKLVNREPSISVIITSVSNMLPQKYLLEKRAIVDADGGKLLNEDNDLRSVLQYLLDDVSDFLSTHSTTYEDAGETKTEEKGSANILKAFIDYIALRETENFRSRRRENENSVTLTTIHQSKGLEWDVVFIVKVNDSEIPLLHEYNGIVNGGTTLEEERRLMYVAMTRARKKLYILYVLMDSNWQLLQPSRFLKEIPAHLFDIQGENGERTTKELIISDEKKMSSIDISSCEPTLEESPRYNTKESEHSPSGSIELADICLRNNFLKRFNVEERSVVSHLFHQWAKKSAFQQPKRLLEKVSFVIDERLRTKAYKHKDVMRTLKPCLTDEDAFLYAQYVLRWEQVPLDKRAHLMREKQEHFQKQRIENSMGSSEATAKQISYLQSLGCTIKPDSRLHASRLIEQYKAL